LRQHHPSLTFTLKGVNSDYKNSFLLFRGDVI